MTIDNIVQLHRRRARKRKQMFLKKLNSRLRLNFFYAQNRAIKLSCNILLKSARNFPKKKKAWMVERTDYWWQNIVANEDPEKMIKNFRTDKMTFDYLCESLSPQLKPKSLQIREPISLEKKVAIGLYKLASGDHNRIVGDLFGVHPSSARKCLLQFCEAVLENFLSVEIKLPELKETEEIISTFETRTGLPQVIGAIDSIHIPLSTKVDGTNFLNRNGWRSLILQVVVDCNYLFRNITCRHPGNTSYTEVFKDSSIYKNRNKLEWPSAILDGKQISAYIIGSPAFPLLPWLMVNYSDEVSIEEDSLNAYFNQNREVVEHALERLRGRWKILQKPIDMKIDKIPMVIKTCCVLHNLLERHQNPYDPSWDNISQLAQPLSEETEITTPGAEIREFLNQYMTSTFPLLSSALINL